MKLSCDILSPDGDSHIPLELFFDIYEYLASVDGTVPPQSVIKVRHYLEPIRSV